MSSENQQGAQGVDGQQPAGIGEGVASGEAGTAAAAQSAADGVLVARIAELEVKAAENFDLYVRARAEMDNVRRRSQDEVSKAHKFAIEAFAESLLPVRDSLEMALKTTGQSAESLREGVEATLRQLASAFEKNRLIEIDPLGQKFDPNHHQAIAAVPASSTQPPVPVNHVAAVLQKGYLINDRVLRPALVSVAQA